MRWVFIPNGADQRFFAAAVIALRQEQATPFAVAGWDGQAPLPVKDLLPEMARRVALYSPLEFAVMLSPASHSFTPLLQTDRRWATARLGEGGETIGQSGCLVTSLAMLLQDVYGTLVRPDVLADMLVLTRDGFTGDFLNWTSVISGFSLLSAPVRRNGAFSTGYVQSLLDGGYKVVVANYRISHFGYLIRTAGRRYLVADPVRGVVEWTSIGGIRAAKVRDAPPFEGEYALYIDDAPIPVTGEMHNAVQ